MSTVFLRRVLTVLTIALILFLAVISPRNRHWFSSHRSATKIVDEADVVPANYVDQLNEYLDALMYESGVDVRVRIVRSTRGQPLQAFALRMMREQGIGKDVGGRGLLIVIDDSTKQSRVEVGPHLEGIFPDGFVGYLLREQLGPVFNVEGRGRYAGPGHAIYSTLLMLHRRIRDARLGAEWDPRVLNYINDVRALARGGGASAAIPHQAQLHRLLSDSSDSAIAAYFSPQPTVEEAYQRELEFLALGLWPRWVPLFRETSRDFMEETQPNTRADNDYLLMGEYGYSYEIIERGDDAMLYYTGTPFESPLFFRRSAAGWQRDIVADVRNSQEVIATFWTWRMRIGRDRSGAVFQDRYELMEGTPVDQLYRIRGGDNRPLCIFGDPKKPDEQRALEATCRADSVRYSGKQREAIVAPQ